MTMCSVLFSLMIFGLHDEGFDEWNALSEGRKARCIVCPKLNPALSISDALDRRHIFSRLAAVASTHSQQGTNSKVYPCKT